MRVCKPANIIFDVGANVGAFATVMARLGRGASVFCFEFSPETAEQLRRNIKANNLSNVSVHQVALSDKGGTALFSNSQRDSATNALVSVPSETSISVQTATLDSFLSEHGISEVDFVKIDVEGAEPLVLRGAKQSLKSRAIKLALIELCPGNLAKFGFSLADLFDAACINGWALHELRDDGTPGVRYSPEMIPFRGLLNAILFNPSTAPAALGCRYRG
jgi:FkbM family methyltransferase